MSRHWLAFYDAESRVFRPIRSAHQSVGLLATRKQAQKHCDELNAQSCENDGHRWLNTSSVQTIREKGKWKEVWETSRLCTRCGLTEIIGTEPYVEGVTKR